MEEILSEKEVSDLLNAISGGNYTEDEYSSLKSKRNVRIYDFKRPTLLSKVQIATLYQIHENFAYNASEGISDYLNEEIKISLASVDQLTVGEFLGSVPSSSTFAMIHFDSLDNTAMLNISSELTFQIVDLYLKGKGKYNENREVSDMELMFMEKIIHKLLGFLDKSWSIVFQFSSHVERIVKNHNNLTHIAPNILSALISFEFKIGKSEFYECLCIPYSTLEPILPQLTNLSMSGSFRPGNEYDSLGANCLEKAKFKRFVSFDLPNMNISELSKYKEEQEINVNNADYDYKYMSWNELKGEKNEY